MKNRRLLLETIRLENGSLPYLAYHQKRLEQSLSVHYDRVPELDLEKEIEIPEKYREGLFKVRVVYGEEIENIEFQPYAVRPVNALQMVHIDRLDYAHKYADRKVLQDLFQARDHGDDILMIRKDLLTDTSYANVALYDGNKWFTPARPLLSGTAWSRYLDQGLLHPQDIHYRELGRFRELRLINAMMEWEEGPSIPVDRVRW